MRTVKFKDNEINEFIGQLLFEELRDITYEASAYYTYKKVCLGWLNTKEYVVDGSTYEDLIDSIYLDIEIEIKILEGESNKTKVLKIIPFLSNSRGQTPKFEYESVKLNKSQELLIIEDLNTFFNY